MEKLRHGSVRNNNIQKEASIDLIYTNLWPLPPLGFRNKALICPRCGNGAIGSYDHHCSECGAYLYQECTDPSCDYSPDSNARYCSRCGQVTTFFRDKYLMSWEEEAELYIADHSKSM
ncbi:hypothetical protein [Clostridium thermarum]|uniref:hypothetical protein n=1 Tax=Clostridium thermarum TaxID=1716543 RepID=UPI0013D71B89|nr:hypothetical protein [Clostridium thermarum]